MVSLESLRSYYIENGFYLLMRHALVAVWIRVNSAMLARAFSVRRLTIEPPFRIRGRRAIVMGENFAAGPGLWLDAISTYGGRSYHPRIYIGANVSLSENVHIAATSHVEIGENVLVGSKVLITDHNHGSYSGEQASSPLQPPSRRPLESSRRTLVGRNVWLGDGVVVAPGATIGDGSIIGANSVVVGSIPANCIAAGAPAKVLKQYSAGDEKWLKVDA